MESGVGLPWLWVATYRHKSQQLFHQPPVRMQAELYVEKNDNCTLKKKKTQKKTKNKLQLLLVVVIVGQTPASATDRPAGPWEGFHATPGGTVNYPTRYSNICFCASAEQTRQFKTYQGITTQQLNMTLIFPPSHTRGAKLHCAAFHQREARLVFDKVLSERF